MGRVTDIRKLKPGTRIRYTSTNREDGIMVREIIEFPNDHEVTTKVLRCDYLKKWENKTEAHSSHKETWRWWEIEEESIVQLILNKYGKCSIP
jgi:hypothetical protein